MIKKPFPIIVALATLSFGFAPVATFSMGVGQVTLNSFLNEPLRAEIPLYLDDSIEWSEIQVKLASQAEFDKAGMDRSFYLTKIKFEVIGSQNNQPVIVLTTEDSLSEPFLNLLIEIKSPTGDLIQECTLLLDPPAFVRGTTSKKTQNSISPKKENSPLTQTTFGVQTKLASFEKGSGGYYPVTRKDNLSIISKKLVEPIGAELSQGMIALYQKNPEAFIRGNINLLKSGVSLNLPTDQEIKRISVLAAQKLIQKHNIAWRTKQPIFVNEDLASAPKNLNQQQNLTEDLPSQGNEWVEENRVMVSPDLVDENLPLKLLAPIPKEPVTLQNVKSGGQIIPDRDLSKMQQRMSLIEEALDTLERNNQDLSRQQAVLKAQNSKLSQLLTLRNQEIDLLKETGAAPELESGLVEENFSGDEENGSGSIFDQPILQGGFDPKKPSEPFQENLAVAPTQIAKLNIARPSEPSTSTASSTRENNSYALGLSLLGLFLTTTTMGVYWFKQKSKNQNRFFENLLQRFKNFKWRSLIKSISKDNPSEMIAQPDKPLADTPEESGFLKSTLSSKTLIDNGISDNKNT